jgi:hypothetical protein
MIAKDAGEGEIKIKNNTSTIFMSLHYNITFKGGKKKSPSSSKLFFFLFFSLPLPFSDDADISV